MAQVLSAPPKIAILDYDMGNLHSVGKVLDSFGVEATITDTVEELWQSDALIVPGVGAFDPAMQHLKERDLIAPLREIAGSGKPILGICLGMQVFFEGSEEGRETGLGIIPGGVKRFVSEPGLTIPHMGWNTLQITQPHCALWQGMDPQQIWAYFVHSYYVAPSDSAVCAAQVTHGQQTVTAAIAHENIFATQFHPEKSSTQGLRILKNFVAIVEQQRQRMAVA